MIPIKTIARASLCALAVFSAVSAAHASPQLTLGDTVNVTSETEATGETATIHFAGLPGGSGSLTAYTAPVFLAGTFGAASTPFSGLLAYCTDLYQYSTTPASYTVALLTSSNQPNSTPALTTAQINDIASLINNSTHTDQAATQLAIWSVEYGSAFSFTGASGNTAANAANYLADPNLNGTAPAGVTIYQLQSSAAQGFAFVQPVPEPAALALLGLGTIAIGAVKGRRRQPSSAD